MNLIERLTYGREAGAKLDFAVESPYRLSDGTVVAVAYLPNFGSPQGMIVGLVKEPDFTPDRALAEIAAKAGMYCSFVNADVFDRFDAERFKDALSDWGFFGVDSKRPIWLGRLDRN